MARSMFRTIEDVENYYYGGRLIEKARIIRKDDPALTTTTGIYNAVYGQQVWSQLNQEANAFGCLPKYPWDKSGWRIITTRASTSGTEGISEGGALPTTDIPDFAEISTKPKTVAHTFDVSEVQEFIASEAADDAFGAMAHMRPIIGVHHKERLNVHLLGDVETAAGNNFDSIDRVTLSEAARSALGITDDRQDMYGISRDDDTIYDGYTSHNSTTDRTLTDSILRTALWNLGHNGANTSVIITGHDTKSAIDGLFEASVRYQVLGETTVSVGVNGIQTQEGFGYGVRCATYQGIPIIISKNTVADTIRRIYMLDTSDPEGFGKPRLGIMIAKPTQYFEGGMLTGNPWANSKFSTEGLFRTLGELICRNFQVQGSIRDLK